MANVYVINEVVGSSEKSIDDAIEQAVRQSSEAVRSLRWFEVKEIRGHLNDDGSIGHYQVVLKIGFQYRPEVAHASKRT